MVSAATGDLPPLRRKRRVNIPGLIGRVSANIATIDSQVEPWAQAWDEHNASALAEDGPLWVALGDSSTQGIGAEVWDEGWVFEVLERLRAATGEPWRVINLAMSGGRFRDVSDLQIPVLRKHLPAPDLVTCVIGSNDMMWRRSTDPVVADAQRVADTLPEGTVLSRIGGPGKRPRLVNKLFATAAAERDYRLFSIWDWPGAHGALAVDRMHPSNLGYEYMADLVWDALPWSTPT